MHSVTDGRTDGPTDRRTDKVTYRVAWTRLNKITAQKAQKAFRPRALKAPSEGRKSSRGKYRESKGDGEIRKRV